MKVEMSDWQAVHIERLLQHWKYFGISEEYGEFDVIDWVARDRGWLPLNINEEMSVGFNGKRYSVKRTE